VCQTIPEAIVGLMARESLGAIWKINSRSMSGTAHTLDQAEQRQPVVL